MALLIVYAILSLALVLISGTWQVLLIAIGMGMFGQSDLDHVHHPSMRVSHRSFQIWGGVLAVLGALALRLL